MENNFQTQFIDIVKEFGKFGKFQTLRSNQLRKQIFKYAKSWKIVGYSSIFPFLLVSLWCLKLIQFCRQSTVNGSKIPVCTAVTTKQLAMIRGFSITRGAEGKSQSWALDLNFHVLTVVYLIFPCYGLLLAQKDYNESLGAQW